ncbi:MAG: maleylpyruvate isomerase family mycothiol-dependent enzyme [Actinoallomurus sp.]
MDLTPLAHAERADLAAFLETLTSHQWEAPTLCTGWCVRDLVAHVISYDEINRRALVARRVKGTFHRGGANAIGVAEYNRRSPEELIGILRDNLDPHGLPAAFGGKIALTDGVIHHQDIRRPLGLPREVPGERLLPALQTALFAPVIRGFWTIRSLRLVATDIDWTTGKGPEVRGRAEALLLAVAGRAAVVDELTGPGQPELASRLGQAPARP